MCIRDRLEKLTYCDVSNESFPYLSSQYIDIGYARVLAIRVTYVGELGWELYVPADQAAHVFEEILAAGADHGLKLCGLHAMDSCRIEKGFRHFGNDITDEDHVLEAGLGFAVKTEKLGGADFLGREAVLRKKETGLERRMMQFCLTDPSAHLHHNEPILRDGKIVSYVTSANYGHAIGGSVGMGYVPCAAAGEKPADMLSSRYQIEIAGRLYDATASLKPMYDPKSLRPKAGTDTDEGAPDERAQRNHDKTQAA